MQGTAVGGFGAAPNTTPGGFGGFGSTTTGGFGTAAGASGLGTGTNTATGGFGGFGSTTTGGFGTAAGASGLGTGTNTATGGFGGFGSTTTGGFGTAAGASGLGTGTNTATGGFGGFGSTTTGGFGTAAGARGLGTGTNTATGGFGGFGSTTTGGFGTAANTTTGGFGASAFPSNNNATELLRKLQEFGGQSALGRYLLELDNAYNALHPNCRFRAFLYNMCAPGQSTMAVERERFIAAQAGGGCREEELLRAQERNPDPLRMYPTPVHFMQELKTRVEKQQEAIKAMMKHVDILISKSQRFRELDEANAEQYRELMLEQVMLQRRWYSLLKKVETLRLLGLPLGEETRIASTAKALNMQLAAPGVYKTALSELQPFLDAESASVASLLRSRPGDEAHEPTLAKAGGMLQGRTDPQLLKSWTSFAEHIQEGVEALIELLEKDSADMRTIRDRVSSV